MSERRTQDNGTPGRRDNTTDDKTTGGKRPWRRTYPSVARPERADGFNGWVDRRNEDGGDNGARGGWQWGKTSAEELSPMCPKGTGVMRPWSDVAVTIAIKRVDDSSWRYSS